jgi:hypothetical protein
VVQLHSAADRGRYGLVSQGFPQLVRVSADICARSPAPSRSARPSFRRCAINEAPWIPDLERIEEMISEETSVLVE